jgi:hypothetical protein
MDRQLDQLRQRSLRLRVATGRSGLLPETAKVRGSLLHSLRALTSVLESISLAVIVDEGPTTATWS